MSTAFLHPLKKLQTGHTPMKGDPDAASEAGEPKGENETDEMTPAIKGGKHAENSLAYKLANSLHRSMSDGRKNRQPLTKGID